MNAHYKSCVLVQEVSLIERQLADGGKNAYGRRYSRNKNTKKEEKA